MSDLIQAIKRREPPEIIARFAEKEKETVLRRNENSPLQVVLKMVQYDPSLSDEYLEENNYLRRVFHVLLDHGADASILNNVSSLGDIVDPALLRKLLSKGFQVDTQDDHGRTLFMILLIDYDLIYDYRENGREHVYEPYMRSIEEMLMILLEHDADMSLQARHDEFDALNGGGNAIHVMMSGIITPFILQLFRRTANPDNINVPNDHGVTPYIRYAMTRAERGPRMADLVPIREMVQALVEAGADVMARDDEGKSALDYAIQSGKQELIRILREKEAEFKGTAQGTLLSRTRNQSRYGITPGIAKRITNFLGGKRKTRKGRKARKTRKARKAKKAKKAATRRRA